MTDAAPDPDRRRPALRGGPARSHGAGVGTDTPPETLVEYPAQRRREDTWPPPSAPPSPPPNGAHGAGVPPMDDTARSGGHDVWHGHGPVPPYDAHPTGPLATPAPSMPPGAPAPPGHPPPAPEHPAGPAPAPRDGTGPIAGPGPNGTAVGDITPVGPGGPADPTGAPPPADPAATPSEPDPDLDDEVDELDLEADDDDRATGWALVRASQEGDTAAFGQLFDRYHDVVFRFVLFRLGDRSAAEDLTQETFVRAFRRIGSVSYQGRDIGAWFVTIARNLVLDHVKSSRYRLESATPEIADVAPGSSRPGPEHEVIAGATHAELLKCVARLGDDQQECITLRFLQGLSVAETADIMGRNEGAVKALQHRAVRRLSQLLPEGLR